MLVALAEHGYAERTGRTVAAQHKIAAAYATAAEGYDWFNLTRIWTLTTRLRPAAMSAYPTSPVHSVE